MSTENLTPENIFKLIEKRYSPVTFSSQNVEEEKLFQLFEAARWAHIRQPPDTSSSLVPATPGKVENSAFPFLYYIL